jgi:nucleoside-diphosphate-sugar epimerase
VGKVKSVLITGAAGFIGQYLVTAAEDEGYDVVGVARRPLASKSIVLDLRNSLASLPTVDWVFHLAGNYAGSSLARLQDSELLITRNLLDWGLKRGIRNWVFTSAAEVYGMCSGAVSEDGSTNPVIPYGVAKLREEEMFSAAARNYPDGRFIILRIGEVYGQGGKLIDELTRRFISGFCPWFGSGDVPVSFVHVKDVVRVILAAIQIIEKGVFIWNVADDMPTKWQRFLFDFAEMLGTRKPISLPLTLAHTYAMMNIMIDTIRGRSPIVTRNTVKLLTTSKAMSNEKIKRDLGITFQYPNYQSGLNEILGQSAPK